MEVWQNKKLVGGLYGIELEDTIFCGESMFSYVTNASKIGFVSFIQNSKYQLIDCQLHTNYLESLGAEHVSRSKFMQYINKEIPLNK